MSKILTVFEKVVASVLILLMIVVISLATVDLGWTLIRGVLRPPPLRLSIDDLLDVFGMFLLVLVGMELLDTIKAYVSEHAVHAEVVFIAAMIAVARKVITLDVNALPPASLLGIATILLALSVGHYLFKQSRTTV